jgi:hypothetical protein
MSHIQKKNHFANLTTHQAVNLEPFYALMNSISIIYLSVFCKIIQVKYFHHRKSFFIVKLVVYYFERINIQKTLRFLIIFGSSYLLQSYYFLKDYLYKKIIKIKN